MIPFLSKESFTCHQLKKHEFLVEPHKIYRQLFYVVKGASQLFQEVPHKYIARYLRMTPETLSRLQKS